jgi:heat shock protein HtpX
MNSLLKTGVLMAAMTALFMGAGQVLGGQSGLIIALGFAVVMNFSAYWYSDKVALATSKAREVTPAQAPELHLIVTALASRAGLPKPRIYLMDDPTPNAFATGRNPDHAAIAVTTGLMNILDRSELEGVVAHELAHIKNRDILISSIAATFAGAISSLAMMAQWAMIFGGFSRDDEGEGGGLIGGLLMMVVAPLAASLIQMAISRSREFQADATGAAICGRPQSLAFALQKLEQTNRVRPMDVNPATAQMYIVNPLSGGQLAGLFATHPPMKERIARLLNR